ncbi:MAG: hypothetical protein AB8G16_00540 [Gammaproteobacteria bacterium]
MKRALPWVLALIPAAVFLVFLPAKFSGAAETQHIFSTVGAWFASIGLGAIREPFSNYGGYLIGSVELIAAVMLLVPRTRFFGALLGAGVLSGALFFHLFTPLGVAVNFPGSEGSDPTLFILAVISWACCVFTLVRERPQAQPALAGVIPA